MATSVIQAPPTLAGLESRVFPLDFTPTIPQLLARAVERFGSRVLIASLDEHATFADVDARSRDLAKRLLADGVGKGTRVGLMFPQGSDWVVAFLAVARIGAFAMPFSTFYKPAELARGLRMSDTEVLLMPSTMFGKDMVAFVADALPALAGLRTTPIFVPDAPFLRSVMFLGSTPDRPWATEYVRTADSPVSDELLAAVEAEVTPADLLVTLFTSGTTAAPKGVVHTHGALVRHSANLVSLTHLSPDDNVFAGMPFFWVGGMTTTLLPAMHVGGKVLTQGRFDSGEALVILEKHAATRLIAWPTLRQRLQADPDYAKYDLSRIGAFPSVDGRRHASLGMTETSGPHTLADAADNRTELPEHLNGSFGPPVPFVEHRIADPVTNETLEPGQVGEICVRGYSVMQGMYKKEREEVFDADGWYHTGDRGYFTEGFLIFEGRSSEMIKSAGSNVSPREVESELESLAGIESAWVFGFPHPDRGETVVAGLLTTGDVDTDEITKVMSERLSSFKVPREIVLLDKDEIPLLATGKANRLAVRDVIAKKTGR